MQEKLFSEFTPSSLTEWKNQLIKELKGDDYATLQWQNENGFTIEPFYTSTDLKQEYKPAFTHCDWNIGVTAKGKNTKETNTHLLTTLQGGATAVSINNFNAGDEVVLEGIRLDFIHSNFHLDQGEIPLLASFLKKNYEAYPDSCVFDKEFTSADAYRNWYKVAAENLPSIGYDLISVDNYHFHNRNCQAYYEIALLFAQLIEKLEILKNEDATDGTIAIKTGVSSDYFSEIAKLRAIRRLWNLLSVEYKRKNKLYLITQSSLTNKSVSDNYNNLLRTTVEAMAAVMGGCNELILSGYDDLLPVQNALGRRMTVNQQHILKYESYFDKVADVACGSYYLETFTDLIAQRALEAIKEIESKGGYLKCLENGEIESELRRQAQNKASEIKEGKKIIIGVNKFFNEKDKIQLTGNSLNDLISLSSHIGNPVLEYELNKYYKLHA